MYAVGEMMISGEEVDVFIESLAAAGTDMATFFKVQDRMEAADGNVFYDLRAIIVDFAGDPSTCRTVVQAFCHLQMNMHFIFMFFDIYSNHFLTSLGARSIL